MSNFEYEELVQRALMDVVREVLESVSRDGLSGEHFFYVRFRTDHPQSQIPFFLKQRHPEEVMIVIQHQFWNLVVNDDYFCVDLAFSGVQQTLTVPFSAITAFVDPSVKFALQFTPNFENVPFSDPDPDKTNIEKDNPEKAANNAPSDNNIISFDSLRKK